VLASVNAVVVGRSRATESYKSQLVGAKPRRQSTGELKHSVRLRLAKDDRVIRDDNKLRRSHDNVTVATGGVYERLKTSLQAETNTGAQLLLRWPRNVEFSLSSGGASL